MKNLIKKIDRDEIIIAFFFAIVVGGFFYFLFIRLGEQGECESRGEQRIYFEKNNTRDDRYSHFACLE